MNKADFEKTAPGELIPITTPAHGWAFIPKPLPPEIIYDSALVSLLGSAHGALGILEGVGRRLPNPMLFMRPYIRKEALASSRIEGTVMDSNTLFQYEAAREASLASQPDIQEVINYESALRFGIRQLRQLPLSQRFARAIHERLMRGVRGENRAPGEFRRGQNWIGPPGITGVESFQSARFVPPPVSKELALSEMHKALNAWESFLHQTDLDPLIQCALLHYQFEAIHPFEDGNGRVGRILCLLFLMERKILSRPLLHLSAYFERHREEYYKRLLDVSRKGNWTEWIEFFLTGVAEQAAGATDRAERLFAWRDEVRRSLPAKKRLFTPRLLVDALLGNPYMTVPSARRFLKTNYPTAKSAVEHLVKAGILQEMSRERRPRLFLCPGTMKLLTEDM